MIRRFCRQLPGWVDQATRERAEAQLARQGGQVRPNNYPGWPPRSLIASTPTAPTATRTGRGGAL
ncbi:hypothetical protein BZL30_5474 [Mycobacterium kansasii]|uniref:Uncharacterized protein n=1 Tax=Mycobacterium kansasii TaxID=1768 RepID=A0A1V3WZC2_MYCKA|nr:hypothetical protein BZL30_5474 [Mycobacterium kansasii]